MVNAMSMGDERRCLGDPMISETGARLLVARALLYFVMDVSQSIGLRDWDSDFSPTTQGNANLCNKQGNLPCSPLSRLHAMQIHAHHHKSSSHVSSLLSSSSKSRALSPEEVDVCKLLHLVDISAQCNLLIIE